MKKLLVALSLVVCGAVAEPPAPYPPSGWKPSGSSFDLPQREQSPQAQEYLPPLDPRNPSNPSVEYGVPEEDVSVQGLPVQEEVQFFQNSPINGQQNVGAGFKSDIRNLDQGIKQSQYQQQQQTYRQFDIQRQIDAQNTNRLPNLQPPSTFARTPAPAPTEAPSTEGTTTELSLNEGETLDAPKNAKVSVEVSRQKLQEYPGELFLSSLAQLQLQPQFVPLQQFGQSAPLILQQQSQKQVAGYDAQTHFAALPSVLAQQQLQQQKITQNPQLLIAEQQQPLPQYQPVNTYQQPILQSEPVALQPQQQIAQYQPQPQLQPKAIIQPQTVYAQPNTVQYQPQQFPPQSVVLQPQAVNQLQPGQPQPDNPDAEPIDNRYQPQLYQQPFLVPQPNQFQPQQGQFQPQQAQFQPQPALIQASQQGQYQPLQAQFQPQPELIQAQPQQGQFQPQQAQFQPQPALIQASQQGQYQPQQVQFQPQPELIQAQPQQGQFQPQQAQFQPQPALIQAQPITYPNQEVFPPQQQFQSPDALQSGLDTNQQGNDIDEPEDEELEGEDEGNKATAVATAFGTRTQPRTAPRVYTQYGAPFPVPKVQARPGYTTTESPVEDITEDVPIVAQAVAVADGRRKTNARLRSRRVRPLFTVDRSGHLVLAQGQ